MPASVTIIAGQSSASFTIIAGATPQTVTITASAGGFQSGSASLTIQAPPLGQYEVHWLGNFEGNTRSSATSANSNGEIVGRATRTVDGALVYVATRFTADGPVDLNDEMADLLNLRTDGPWRAWVAYDINDFGQIAGNITKSPGSRAFVYDSGVVTDQRSLTIVEHPEGWRVNVGGINNWGQIFGDYRTDSATVAFVANPPDYQIIDVASAYIDDRLGKSINNMGQLALHTAEGGMRYTPQDDLGGPHFDIFAFWLTGINELGDVAGQLRTEVKKGNKVERTYSIYRAASPDSVETIYHGTLETTHPSINDYRDVAFTQNRRLFLSRVGVDVVNIDTLIEDTKWKNASGLWCHRLMNPSVDLEGNVGLPIVVGGSNPSSGGNEAFVLIPIVP